MALRQVTNRADLYEQVANSVISDYLKAEERLACPSFDHTVYPWEHAYVMTLRDFFSMNGEVTCGNAVLFRIPTEEKATGSHALSVHFRRKVEAFITNEVVEFAQQMIRRANEQ